MRSVISCSAVIGWVGDTAVGLGVVLDITSVNEHLHQPSLTPNEARVSHGAEKGEWCAGAGGDLHDKLAADAQFCRHSDGDPAGGKIVKLCVGGNDFILRGQHDLQFCTQLDARALAVFRLPARPL